MFQIPNSHLFPTIFRMLQRDDPSKFLLVFTLLKKEPQYEISITLVNEFRKSVASEY